MKRLLNTHSRRFVLLEKTNEYEIYYHNCQKMFIKNSGEINLFQPKKQHRYLRKNHQWFELGSAGDEFPITDIRMIKVLEKMRYEIKGEYKMIILAFYISIDEIPPPRVIQYLDNIKQQLSPLKEKSIEFFVIPIRDGNTRVECVYPTYIVSKKIEKEFSKNISNMQSALLEFFNQKK